MLEYDLRVENRGHHLRLRGTNEVLSAEPQSWAAAWHFAKLFPMFRRQWLKRVKMRIDWKQTRMSRLKLVVQLHSTVLNRKLGS